jgi:hypothetical protein
MSIERRLRELEKRGQRREASPGQEVIDLLAEGCPIPAATVTEAVKILAELGVTKVLEVSDEH